MSESAPISDSTPLSDWLAELAQPTAAPGGGAASSVMLATAAALLRMVAEYTPDDPQASGCAARLVSGRTEALDVAKTDGLRSADLGAALSLSADDPERDRRVREAAIAAARSSESIGEVGRSLIPELELLIQVSNPHLVADLAVAATALHAGMAGASINLRANLQMASKHGAPRAVLTGLHAEARRLSVDQAAVADFAEQVSATFDR